MIMNKTTKIVLIGLGVVAVGATAYFLLKPKATEAETAPVATESETTTSSTANVKKGKKRGIGRAVLGVAVPALGAGMLIQKFSEKRKARRASQMS
jgi:hypothetical protein